MKKLFKTTFGKMLKTYKLEKLFVIILFLFGSSGLLLAQSKPCTYSVSGKILDVETKEPIPYVTVKVKGVEKFTSTNLKGEFFIDNLCDENNVLIVSCLGYCNTTCEHYHNHHQEKTPHIYLTQEVSQLGEVTIQAEKDRIKGTETISQITLKKEDLGSDPTQSLAASIADQNGVTLISRGANVQLPVIHGLSGNRILILNNNLKHSFQNWGAEHAPEIDISTANSITIIKGAAGVRYGPEALGGAISIESAPLPLNQSFQSKLGTGYQTNGKGYFVNSEISHGLKSWSYHLGANYVRVGDRHTPDYILTNSGKEEKSINAGLRYHLKGWNFKVYYSYIDQNLALLRSSVASSGNAFVRALNSDEPIIINPFSYDINEPNQLTQHHLGKVEVDWWYSDDAKFTFRYGRQLNKRDEFDVRRNVEKPIIDLDLITNDYQLEWKHPGWLLLDGLVGLQGFTQKNNNLPGTGTTPFIPNYETLRYSGFITESLKKDKNTYELGVRMDYELNKVAGRETNQDIFNDQFSFTNLTSSLGYVRQLSENSSFRTNIGTAWRTPNMAELYSFGQQGFKTTFGLLRYYVNEEGNFRTNRVLEINNSDVQPEKGYKFINEFQTSKNKNTHTLTAYSHYIQNYIFERPLGVFGTVRGPMPAFIFEQTNAFFIGADYSWKRDWSKQFSGTFGASYLWSKNIDEKEPLINQPPISLNYKLVWNHQKLWKLESSKITIKPGYTFQQFQAPRTISPENLIDGSVPITPDSEIFDFKDAPNGYFLLDASWSFKWKNLSGSVSVNNLLNTRYRNYLNELRYFADETGRNVLFTLNYIFKAKNHE